MFWFFVGVGLGFILAQYNRDDMLPSFEHLDRHKNLKKFGEKICKKKH